MLDVGCGSGRLACILTTRAERVDALDRSSMMIERARRRCSEAPNLRVLEGDLLDLAVPLSTSGYDAITALASLHHMPLQSALERLAGLLRPGCRPTPPSVPRSRSVAELANPTTKACRCARPRPRWPNCGQP